MGMRGRNSSGEIALIGPAELELVPRQKPPRELTDEEVRVWRAVVSSEPADWFSPSTSPLLAQYCRHVVHTKRIAEMIERATCDPNLAVTDYERLLKMQQRESQSVAMLAMKMRLAQQATITHRGNKKPSGTRKPWEEPGAKEYRLDSRPLLRA